MRAFVRQLQAYDQRVTGPSVVIVEAGNAVMNAFRTALLNAFMAITLLLLLLMKSKCDVIVIVVTVLVGAVFTYGCMLLFKMPFNFANIIGLPLLLGIGVDSGIHITERFHEEENSPTNIYMTSATRGIVVSTLTTVFSLASLAISPHQGTASMGLLLSSGLISMMVATMLILPSFMIWRDRLGKKIC